MNQNEAILLPESEEKTMKSFIRKSRVTVPEVATSPSTLKLMEENERIIKKYSHKPTKDVFQKIKRF